MLFDIHPPTSNLGWNTRNRLNSPRRGAPEMKQQYEVKRSGARRTWNEAELEELLRDKINQKTAGANNRILQAVRLFDRENGVISAEAWKRALPVLVGIDLTDEESMALFRKYDDDGEVTMPHT